MLFRAITFNVTHASLPRVDITYKFSLEYARRFKVLNFLYHDIQMKETRTKKIHSAFALECLESQQTLCTQTRRSICVLRFL